MFGRIGYAPQKTNPVTRDGSVALIANGVSDDRPNDSMGVSSSLLKAMSIFSKSAASLRAVGTTFEKSSKRLFPEIPSMSPVSIRW